LHRSSANLSTHLGPERLQIRMQYQWLLNYPWSLIKNIISETPVKKTVRLIEKKRSKGFELCMNLKGRTISHR